MKIKLNKLVVALAAAGAVTSLSPVVLAQNDAIEEVVVSGMRSSLETSVSIKRNTMEIVDSITAEDIGKLPDPNVAETLTRIPGVQGYRYGGEGASPVGEGSGLTIRGLSGQTASRVDGRAYFTAGGREFNIEGAIPGMIAGIDVYKNPSAEHVEGGIGGMINIKTRKPLDFAERTINVAASGRYNDLTKDISPEYFGLFTNRWDTSVGEIGVLIAGNYQESHNRSDNDPVFGRGEQLRRAVRADSDEYADFSGANQSYAGRSDVWYLADVSCPDGSSYTANPTCLSQTDREGLITTLGQSKQVFQEDINRIRKGANLAFQWRPSDTFELYATGNYNYYLYDQDYRFMAFNSGGYQDSRTVQNLKTVNYILDEEFMNRNLNGGANELVSGQRLASGTFLDTSLETWGGHEDSPYETWIAAVGGKWQTTDKLEMTFDLSTIQATRDRDNRRVVFVPRSGVTWDVSRTLMKEPHRLDMSGPDLRDPSNFVLNFYDNGTQQSWDDDGLAAQVDFKYEIDIPLIESFKFGARYASQTARYSNFGYGGRPLTTDGAPLAADQSNAISAASLPELLANSPTNWLGGDAGYSGGYVVYNPGALSGNQVRDRFPLAGVQTDGEFVELLTDRRNSEEDSLAAYFLANFAYNDMLRGNVGVRVVQTDLYARAMIRDQSNEIVPNSTSTSYVDVLPSLNLTGYIDESTMIRFGYSKGITRPSLADLNPSVSVNVNEATGTMGNTELEPLEAHSFDLALEKYFSASNYASIGVFYKKIDGFFNNEQLCVDVPGFPTHNVAANGCPTNQYRVTRIVNAEEGMVKGVELAFQTFFDYDFMPQALHNFGVSGSYTVLDTKNPIMMNGEIVDVPMLFQSDNSWTLSGMYENNFMSARLVYTYRSEFTNAHNASPAVGVYTKAYGILDASMSFNLTDDLSLSVNASNLMNEAPNRYAGMSRDYESDFSIAHFVNGRVFGAGLRYSF